MEKTRLSTAIFNGSIRLLSPQDQPEPGHDISAVVKFDPCLFCQKRNDNPEPFYARNHAFWISARPVRIRAAFAARAGISGERQRLQSTTMKKRPNPSRYFLMSAPRCKSFLHIFNVGHLGDRREHKRPVILIAFLAAFLYRPDSGRTSPARPIARTFLTTNFPDALRKCDLPDFEPGILYDRKHRQSFLYYFLCRPFYHSSSLVPIFSVLCVFRSRYFRFRHPSLLHFRFQPDIAKTQVRCLPAAKPGRSETSITTNL